ncbi:hypothetical protein FCV25MIE_29771 [Fagus crenata]
MSLLPTTCPTTIDTIIIRSCSNMTQDTDDSISELATGCRPAAVPSLGSLTQQMLETECRTPHLGHILLTRREILNVRSSNFCQHLNFPTCSTIDAILSKFRPNSEFFEPHRCLPINPLKSNPSIGPNLHMKPSLIDIPISLTTTGPTHIVHKAHKHSVTPTSFLKRKTPSSIPIGDPMKTKMEIQPSILTQSNYVDSVAIHTCPTITLTPVMVVPNCSTTSLPFSVQNFLMAKEASLIMPPPSP